LAESFKGIDKCVWTVPQKADPVDLAWLLCMRRKRPRDRRATKKRDELAPLHVCLQNKPCAVAKA
jgi:hypothetical protein